MIYYAILTYFALRSAQLLYRNKPVGVLGVNLSDPDFDSGSESAPYQLTLADDAGSPDPTQVDYNNGTDQWYKETSVDFSTDANFTEGTAAVIRVGNMVIIQQTSTITHSSGDTAATDAGFIPADLRPSVTVSNTFASTSSEIQRVLVTANGTIQFVYKDYTGSGASLTGPIQMQITYTLK